MSIVSFLVVFALLCLTTTCVGSMSFSCDGCEMKMSDGLTQCTCGTEKKFHYQGTWKYNGSDKVLGTVRSANATHYTLTYNANYNGACIYLNDDYFKLTSPTEKFTTLVIGEQQDWVGKVQHLLNVDIPVSYYVYHCTIDLEVIAAPFYP